MAGKRSTVQGGRAIASSLNKIVPGLGPAISEASRKALRPTLAAAKANLKANGSVDTGQLRKSLGVRKVKWTRKPVVEHAVGPVSGKPHASVAHLVEFGTLPHVISGTVQHPGTAPAPFLRPAYESTKVEARKIFAKTIGPAVERRARKVAKR